MFPIYLGLVSGLGNVLFLGLVLLLIGRVRADLVLLEITNEFRVDTDGASNDAHDVLSECPGLISAHYGDVGHGLARTKNTDEGVFGGHSLRSESEGEVYGEGGTFRNGDGDKRNCHADSHDA